jgi:hypothetical protein
MILAYLILGSIMMFQSGMFWSAYRISKIEDKPAGKFLAWSIGLGLFSVYLLISMIGRASTL